MGVKFIFKFRTLQIDLKQPLELIREAAPDVSTLLENLEPAKVPVAQGVNALSTTLKEKWAPPLIPGEPERQGGLPRVFIFEQAFYSIFQHRRQQIVFGERPEGLAQSGTIDQRILEKHQTYLRRLENFPLKKAAYYRQLQDSTGIKSVRGLSEITGEDWSYIARVLKTLELPVTIQDFLNAHREAPNLKHFNLRRLLEIVRAGNEDLQYARFRETLEHVGSLSAELLW